MKFVSPVLAPLNTVLFFPLAGKYELYDESDVWNTIQQVVCTCTCPHHILVGSKSLHSHPFFWFGTVAQNAGSLLGSGRRQAPDGHVRLRPLHGGWERVSSSFLPTFFLTSSPSLLIMHAHAPSHTHLNLAFLC